MGLLEGLVLLKDLPNPQKPNRIYMNKQIFKINQRGKNQLKNQLNNKGISRVQYLMELYGG